MTDQEFMERPETQVGLAVQDIKRAVDLLENLQRQHPRVVSMDGIAIGQEWIRLEGIMERMSY